MKNLKQEERNHKTPHKELFKELFIIMLNSRSN